MFVNKAVVYDLLFRTAAATLITIVADPKHLGVRIGEDAIANAATRVLTSAQVPPVYFVCSCLAC